MRFIIFVLLLVIATSGSPQAEEERPCTGAYRARVVLFFELVHTRVSIMIRFGAHYFCIGLDVFLSESARMVTSLEESRADREAALEESQANRQAMLQKLREILGLQLQSVKSRCRSIQQALWVKLRDGSVPMAIMFARARNKHESRRTMRRLLTQEDSPKGKMTDALQAHIDRDRLIISLVGVPPPELPPGELERIVKLTAGSFRVCQAVRRKSPAPCANLGSTRSECESLAAKVLLAEGACTEEVIRVLSEITRIKPAAIWRYCKTLANRQPENCLAIPGMSEKEAAICRALAGDGQTACRDPALSEAASRDCLFEFSIREALAGRIPVSAVPDEYKKQELVWPALLAAGSDISCDDLALGVYDEIVATLQLFPHIFG